MIHQKIASLHAWETLDSRGNPTVSVYLRLDGGACGTASVPSGASTGEMEAYEKRDGDRSRYFGKGTLSVCQTIETEIFPAIRGLCANDQRKIDETLCALDGSEQKRRFGANALLAVSLAAARAAAQSYGLPLYRYLGGIYGSRKFPTPMMNVLNGGCHANNNIDIQEFMIVPVGAASFSEAVRIGTEIYHTLKDILQRVGLSVAIGDEGGFAPYLKSDTDAIEFLSDAIRKAGYDTDTVRISLDAAASEWTDNGIYRLPKRNIRMTAKELTAYFEDIVNRYPILSIEDPLGENDTDGWQYLTEKLGQKTMLVGDDLFVTNSSRLAFGIEKNIANAILIKPNQIGTLTQTLNTIHLAAQNGYRTVISHRSGETCDTFISDLALAVGAGYLKAGAPARGERVAKYNRLLKIEQLLKTGCRPYPL